jgi:hypothetical protein
MPIWLRNLTFNLINTHYEKQNAASNNEESWLSGEAKAEAARNKQIKVPSYVTKASKK